MVGNRSFWRGLFMGAAAGAASALLLTPKKGEELRGEIKHTTEEAGRKAGEAWGGLRERSSEMASNAQSHMLRTANRSVDTMNRWRDRLNDSMAADKCSHEHDAREYEENASDTAQIDQL